MKESNYQVFHDKVSIVELTRELASDLMRHNYYFGGSDVLKQGLTYDILQSLQLLPRSTRLVAYHNEDKTAIGFLCLKRNTDKIYSIEKVFVHSGYRKMGVATRLLNYAICLAKRKGARKLSLNVYPTLTDAINLYKRLGFSEISRSILGQGYISGSSVSRLIKLTIRGQGGLTRLSLGKEERLVEVKTNSKRNRETLFRIYQNSVEQKLIDFFEINPDNLINGSRSFWQPPFFKDALINDSSNSFALIFNTPFSSKTTVELYAASNAPIQCMLEDLLEILAKRGSSLTQILLFNPNTEVRDWFRKKNMTTFDFVVMGAKL